MRAAAATMGRRLTHYLDDKRARALRPALLHSRTFVRDFPDASALVVGDIEGAVGSLRNASRAMRRPVRLLYRPREAIGKDLVLRRIDRFPAGEGNEHDVVALLRSGRAVPGAVERDESAALVAGRKERSAIEEQAVRRPVRG